MNPSRDKGTATNTAVVRFLQALGWRDAERRALHGNKDLGDVVGIPGVVIEVKNRKAMALGPWVDEAEVERENADASIGVVWHKRRGTTDPGRWYVTMTGAQFAALLARAVGK